jgi:hypothetical protein
MCTKFSLLSLLIFSFSFSPGIFPGRDLLNKKVLLSRGACSYYALVIKEISLDDKGGYEIKKDV